MSAAEQAMGPLGMSTPHPVRDAVRGGDYERAALRLLYGFLRTLDETAPEVKDELLHLMVERRLPRVNPGPVDRHRAPHRMDDRMGGHR